LESGGGLILDVVRRGILRTKDFIVTEIVGFYGSGLLIAEEAQVGDMGLSHVNWSQIVEGDVCESASRQGHVCVLSTVPKLSQSDCDLNSCKMQLSLAFVESIAGFGKRDGTCIGPQKSTLRGTCCVLLT
jgi:hypothetical protein